jgi:thymidylate synthase
MSDFMTAIRATTLADSWFQLIYALVRANVGRTVYTIDKGSYVGQKRLEFNYAVVQIDHPEVRPLIPDLPPHINIPAPVESMEYVEEYFSNYLMNPQLEENETYKYATWLAPGAERVIEQLRSAPGNNQAAISLGGFALGSDKHEKALISVESPTVNIKVRDVIDTDNMIDPATGQRDPACLRLVDFRYTEEGLLHMFVYFRSWDLWGGYPANLAGLQLYKEYIAESIGAKPGKTIAQSKGLHLYDHAIDVAAQRLGMTEVGTMDDLLDFTSEV